MQPESSGLTVKAYLIELDEQQINLLLTTVTRLVTYILMIKTFAEKHTRELYINGKSRRFPGDILKGLYDVWNILIMRCVSKI